MPTYSKSYSAWLARQTAKARTKYADLDQRVENDALALVFCMENNFVPTARSKFRSEVRIRYFRWRFFRSLADMIGAFSIPFGARTPYQIRLVHLLTLERNGKSKPRVMSDDPFMSFQLIAEALTASVKQDADLEYREYALRILSKRPFVMTRAELDENQARISQENEFWGKANTLRNIKHDEHGCIRPERTSYDDLPESGSPFETDSDTGEGSWGVESSEYVGDDDRMESEEPINGTESYAGTNSFDDDSTEPYSPSADPWRSNTTDGPSSCEFGLGDCHDRPWIEGMLPAYAEVGPGVSGDSSGNWSEA
ncbi:hypothetical protein [Ahniella affigens]|nr:hypothetical protein [Ahniella affigens]